MKFPRIFGRKPEEVKESRTGAAMVLTPGQAVWSPRDYASFAKEAYQQNVVAYQAVNRIAEAVAAVRWTAYRGEQELSEHPVLNVIAKPNPAQTQSEYIQAKVSYLLLAGNGYEEQVVVGDEPKELYQLRPDRMKIVAGSNGFPQAYVYENGGRRVTFDVDPVTLDCDVRHMRLFHPTDDFYGLSPVEASAFAVDQHNIAMAWMQALLQNSATPSGALVTPKERELSAEQFNRLKAELETSYAGAKNAGRPMLLEGGLDWRSMGLSPTDMGIIEAKYSAARDIALGFGVPPQLLGIPGDNTYANYREARLAFYEDTVIPLVEWIAADWSQWLGKGEITIKPDMDQIPAIVEKRETLWNMADKATDLTINERRAMKGYKPIEGGDTLMVSTAQTTLANAIAGPAEPPPEDLPPAEMQKALGLLAYGRE